MIAEMPIYEFKCLKCAHEFEELVKVDQQADCPACGSDRVEKLFSFPSVSTEGSRKRSFAKAREKAKSVHKEKQHAQAEYERNYIKDHS
jgi:putative FmdB family regulatory protein